MPFSKTSCNLSNLLVNDAEGLDMPIFSYDLTKLLQAYFSPFIANVSSAAIEHIFSYFVPSSHILY